LLPGGSAAVPGHANGYYVKPALLTGTADNVCCREEIFGPVAYLLRFRTEQEAIQLVNRSTYGLANSVWTRHLDRANRVAEALVAGNSWINAHNLFPHGVPYGGCNLSGMGGGVLSPETYLDYLRGQSIVRPWRRTWPRIAPPRSQTFEGADAEAPPFAHRQLRDALVRGFHRRGRGVSYRYVSPFQSLGARHNVWLMPRVVRA
jgi:hypothetical protein